MCTGLLHQELVEGVLFKVKLDNTPFDLFPLDAVLYVNLVVDPNHVVFLLPLEVVLPVVFLNGFFEQSSQFAFSHLYKFEYVFLLCAEDRGTIAFLVSLCALVESTEASALALKDIRGSFGLDDAVRCDDRLF